MEAVSMEFNRTGTTVTVIYLSFIYYTWRSNAIPYEMKMKWTNFIPIVPILS